MTQSNIRKVMGPCAVNIIGIGLVRDLTNDFVTFYRTLDSTMTAISGKSLIFLRKISISEKSCTIQTWKTLR